MSTYDAYEWYLRQDLSAHAGKWIAIVDEHVIAANHDVAETLREAKAKTRQGPLITHVSTKLRTLATA